MRTHGPGVDESIGSLEHRIVEHAAVVDGDILRLDAHVEHTLLEGRLDLRGGGQVLPLVGLDADHMGGLEKGLPPGDALLAGEGSHGAVEHPQDHVLLRLALLVEHRLVAHEDYLGFGRGSPGTEDAATKHRDAAERGDGHVELPARHRVLRFGGIFHGTSASTWFMTCLDRASSTMLIRLPLLRRPAQRSPFFAATAPPSTLL